MASQIKVDQIVDSSGTLPVTCPNGMISDSWKNTDGTENYKCRAWVNFDGTLTGTITPRSSGNVSSITKNGTGDYTINFTTNMIDSNYSVANTVMSQATNGSGYSACFPLDINPSVSSFRVIAGVQNAVPKDVKHIHLSVFR